MSPPFNRDDKWQHWMRDRILKPEFYERYFSDYEFIDFGDPRAVGGVDTVVKTEKRRITIDEKIVRWPSTDGVPNKKPHAAYTLETMSCTIRQTTVLDSLAIWEGRRQLIGREKGGWMMTNMVGVLLYCFSNLDDSCLECHWLDFPKLQKWFWHENKVSGHWQPTYTKQINNTECQVVPFEDVERGVGVVRKFTCRIKDK